MISVLNYFIDNLIGIIGICVAGFIAYHVYFLSKKMNLRDKLSHRDYVKQITEKLLAKNTDDHTLEVEIINSKKYEKFYPNNNDRNKDGYTYLKAELKALRFDGVEFFAEMPKSVYKNSSGVFSFKQERENQKQEFIVYPVGLIPYEWIEYIDRVGDEYSWRPQFFVKFLGNEKYPYKYFTYYRESDVYHKGNDPLDMKWRKVEIVG